MQKNQDDEPETMYPEDLASIVNVTEDVIITNLSARMYMGKFYTFIGDVLLALNPGKNHDIYSQEVSE